MSFYSISHVHIILPIHSVDPSALHILLKISLSFLCSSILIPAFAQMCADATSYLPSWGLVNVYHQTHTAIALRRGFYNHRVKQKKNYTDRKLSECKSSHYGLGV